MPPDPFSVLPPDVSALVVSYITDREDLDSLRQSSTQARPFAEVRLYEQQLAKSLVTITSMRANLEMLTRQSEEATQDFDWGYWRKQCNKTERRAMELANKLSDSERQLNNLRIYYPSSQPIATLGTSVGTGRYLADCLWSDARSLDREHR